MNEKLYIELHIEKLKILVRGLALNQPKPEKICLFKSVPAAALPISRGRREDRKDKDNDENPTTSQDEFKQAVQPALWPPTITINGEAIELKSILAKDAGSVTSSQTLKDPRYWILIVGHEDLEPWVDDLNDRLETEWGYRSLAEELAECFKKQPEERFIKDSWVFCRITTEEYASGEWAYEYDGYIDEDGNEIITQEVYFVNLVSELVLFERKNLSEGKLFQIASENLSASGEAIQYAKEMYENGNSLSVNDFIPEANEIISAIARKHNVAFDSLRRSVSDTDFYLKSKRGRPLKN
jgi:hypothetical protein